MIPARLCVLFVLALAATFDFVGAVRPRRARALVTREKHGVFDVHAASAATAAAPAAPIDHNDAHSTSSYSKGNVGVGTSSNTSYNWPTGSILFMHTTVRGGQPDNFLIAVASGDVGALKAPVIVSGTRGAGGSSMAFDSKQKVIVVGQTPYNATTNSHYVSATEYDGSNNHFVRQLNKTALSTMPVALDSLQGTLFWAGGGTISATLLRSNAPQSVFFYLDLIDGDFICAIEADTVGRYLYSMVMSGKALPYPQSGRTYTIYRAALANTQPGGSQQTPHAIFSFTATNIYDVSFASLSVRDGLLAACVATTVVMLDLRGLPTHKPIKVFAATGALPLLLGLGVIYALLRVSMMSRNGQHAHTVMTKKATPAVAITTIEARVIQVQIVCDWSLPCAAPARQSKTTITRCTRFRQTVISLIVRFKIERCRRTLKMCCMQRGRHMLATQVARG
jgi:hypothetical protein